MSKNEFEELFTGIELHTAEDLVEYLEKIMTIIPAGEKRYAIDKKSMPQFFDTLKTFGFERIEYGKWQSENITVLVTENRSGVSILFRDNQPDKPVRSA